MLTGEWYIFGAKSTAIGMIRALRSNHMDCVVKGVIVSSNKGNPDKIEGLYVEELSGFSKKIDDTMKPKINILVATPIYVQQEIKETLKMFGFTNCTLLSSEMEAEYMSKYYNSIGLFPSVKSLSGNDSIPKVCVLEVMHNNDQVLFEKYKNPEWVKGFQAGIEDVSKELMQKVDFRDNTGDNIANKNALYCELTSLYWAWKNICDSDFDYIGISQYRRYLDIDLDDLKACASNDVDVILPFPMIHLPNIKEHHTRYADETEWEALIQAISEISPVYYRDYDRIFNSQYMYNYNMLLAKKEVFLAYCEWLFPILERTEEICTDKGIRESKRYIAYFGESMLTLYFMHNSNKLRICHAGRMLRK